jgi:ribonuclease J
MAQNKKRLRVIPLGGLDEVGKNMTVFEYGNDMVVIDAGIMFPDEDHPGVDLILPDFSYIVENKDRLRGIIITHGHEDHTGALPYLLKEVGEKTPILGTKLTLGIVEGKLNETGIKKPRFREIKAGSHHTLGEFKFDFLPVNHSIPDGVATVIKTPIGNVLHTGDFKLDQTPIDGRLTDYQAIAKASRQGILLLMSDSTNAETPGMTRSEASVGNPLAALLAQAEQRVIVASFASHIHRVQQICDAAVASGRKVVVTGRSMINNTKIARKLGYLDIDEESILDAYEMGDLPPEEICVLSTGSQGEPLSALARMANGDHRTIEIEQGDTVIISATPVPGNEKAVGRVINRLAKAGVDVKHRGNSDVHVSGHAASEELKMMLNLVKPRYFMPIHGETRHLRAHADLAEDIGLATQDIFIMENGEVLEITQRNARINGRVDAGVVYVDGLSVGDVGTVVLRDRQVLARDGIITVVIAVDDQTGKPMADPELVTRGVVYGPESDELMEGARKRISKTMAKTAKEGVTDHSIIKNRVRENLSQYMWEQARRRPMIIPVVMEV